MLTLLLGILFLVAIIAVSLVFLIVLIPIASIDIILLSPVWIPALIAGLVVLIIFLVRRRKILKKLRKGSSFAKLKNEGTVPQKSEKAIEENGDAEILENT